MKGGCEALQAVVNASSLESRLMPRGVPTELEVHAVDGGKRLGL